MGSPSYVGSVVDRNVVMRRIPIPDSVSHSPPKILHEVPWFRNRARTTKYVTTRRVLFCKLEWEKNCGVCLEHFRFRYCHRRFLLCQYASFNIRISSQFYQFSCWALTAAADATTYLSYTWYFGQRMILVTEVLHCFTCSSSNWNLYLVVFK